MAVQWQKSTKISRVSVSAINNSYAYLEYSFHHVINSPTVEKYKEIIIVLHCDSMKICPEDLLPKCIF